MPLLVVIFMIQCDSLYDRLESLHFSTSNRHANLRVSPSNATPSRKYPAVLRDYEAHNCPPIRSAI